MAPAETELCLAVVPLWLYATGIVRNRPQPGIDVPKTMALLALIRVGIYFDHINDHSEPRETDFLVGHTEPSSCNGQ